MNFFHARTSNTSKHKRKVTEILVVSWSLYVSHYESGEETALYAYIKFIIIRKFLLPRDNNLYSGIFVYMFTWKFSLKIFTISDDGNYISTNFHVSTMTYAIYLLNTCQNIFFITSVENL